MPLPRLDVRLESAAGGGTTLTWTIGMRPEASAAVGLVLAVAGLIVLGFLEGGVSLLVSGNVSGLVPALLVPVGVIAVLWGFEAAGVRSLRQDTPRLLGEVNEILGSTATFAGPAAGGGSGVPGLPPHP